jgi:hypothetical protein
MVGTPCLLRHGGGARSLHLFSSSGRFLLRWTDVIAK